MSSPRTSQQRDDQKTGGNKFDGDDGREKLPSELGHSVTFSAMRAALLSPTRYAKHSRQRLTRLSLPTA
jgi:hypothetical protein